MANKQQSAAILSGGGIGIKGGATSAARMPLLMPAVSYIQHELADTASPVRYG